MVHVFEGSMNEDDVRHRNVRIGLLATAQMEEILKRTRGAYVMSQADSNEFRSACLTYCQALTKCIADYVPHHAYFNWTKKSHLILHYADYSKWMHPSLGSCYAGEELMAIVRRLLQAVARASKPLTASNRALERWLHGFAYKLAPDAQPWRRK